MAAAPRPQTSEEPVDVTAPAATAPSAAGADADGWALLEGLRRRLDEQANQHRKTQTEVRQLADSIGALVTEQRKRSRWLNVNSFVAYVMFTLLLGGAFYLLYQNRARDLVGDRERTISERDAAVRRADEALARLAARDAADTKAAEAYALLDAGKRDLAAKKLAELGNAPISKLDRGVLDARARAADVMQVDATLKAVSAAFKTGKHADMIGPLETALTLESQGSRAAQMHYYLGVAYAKTAVLDKSIEHLQAAVDANVDVEDARFHLASVLDRAGQWGKAKVEYDRFATAHPMSSYAAFAMRRGAALDRMPPVGPARGVAAPAAKPAAPVAKPAAAPVAKPAAAPVAKPAAAPVAKPAAPATQPESKTLDFNEQTGE
jgi:tetratricopeptide (TPR) repeat protein